MNYFTIPPNIYNVTTGTVTPLPGGTSDPYVTSNAAYDASGNLLFWVRQTANGSGYEVFGPTGTSVGFLNGLNYGCNTPSSIISYPHREVAITPVPGECKRYFVFFWYANPNLTGESLGFAKIDVSSGVTIALQSQTVMCDGGNGASLAVTKEFGGTRYLIARSYNWLKRYTITSAGLTSPIDLTGALPYVGVTTDLEINGNGTRWMYADKYGSIYISKGNISSGTLTSIATYTVPGNPIIHSVEFNSLGTAFYACTSTGLYYSSVGTGGAMTAIPGTSSYSNTDLEWGKDGYIYLVNNSGQLAKMHATTFVITVISPTVTLNSNDYIPMTGSSIYRLPDQIDGDPYNFSPCGLTLTASQTLLNSLCNPIILPYGNCPNGSCMGIRYCLNLKNTGNCEVTAGTTLILTLDSRLKVCNAASTAQATLIGVFGGSGSSTCATGCCAFTTNTNFGSTLYYTLTTNVAAGTTVPICVDVQTAAPTIDLCNYPLVSNALWTGNCTSGTFSKTQTITYKCCNDIRIGVVKNVGINGNAAACLVNNYIVGDQPIEYTVKVQSLTKRMTGARVQLDENLDISSLAITSVSDGATVERSDAGTIVASFPSGEGEIVYTVKPLADLPDGSRILSTVIGLAGNEEIVETGTEYTISRDYGLSLKDFPVSYYTPGCSEPVRLSPDIAGDANGLSFEWSTGETSEAINVRPSETTAYNVRVRNAAGCYSDWKSAAVVVGDMEAVTNGDQYVDPNVSGAECATVEVLEVHGGTPPYTYEWSNGSTSAETRVCPSSSTTYKVRVTDSNGCETWSGVTVVAAGNKMNPNAALEGKGEFTASPNPFKSSSVIKFSLPMNGHVTLKVYDQMGREVATLHEGQVAANSVVSTEFTPMGLSSGIYFARLTNANGATQTLKLVFAK